MLAFLFLGASVLSVAAAEATPDTKEAASGAADAEKAAVSKTASSRKTVIRSRVNVLRTYPCKTCHLRSNPAEGRSTHRVRLAHMKDAKLCFQCHNRSDLERLNLINGTTVSLDESHTLCGQCHAEKHRDWGRGIHGKHVGSWSGTQYRYTCADCHDPHSPRRPTVKARPGPPFPKFGIRKKAHH